MKLKDIKIVKINKHNPTLYCKVKSGDVTLQEADNILMSEVMNVIEVRGSGTKNN